MRIVRRIGVKDNYEILQNGGKHAIYLYSVHVYIGQIEDA